MKKRSCWLKLLTTLLSRMETTHANSDLSAIIANGGSSSREFCEIFLDNPLEWGKIVLSERRIAMRNWTIKMLISGRKKKTSWKCLGTIAHAQLDDYLRMLTYRRIPFECSLNQIVLRPRKILTNLGF